MILQKITDAEVQTKPASTLKAEIRFLQIEGVTMNTENGLNVIRYYLYTLQAHYFLFLENRQIAQNFYLLKIRLNLFEISSLLVFREFSHLTHNLPQAEKNITAVMS